jgi:hypothetical protein
LHCTISRHRRRSRPAASSWRRRDQEKFKREEHPFDAYPRLEAQAATREPPQAAADNFRWRYYGLFYVAPAQNSYMCRLRIPNGILNALAVRRPSPTRGEVRRRLCACHDARQSADARDPGRRTRSTSARGADQDLGL